VARGGPKFRALRENEIESKGFPDCENKDIVLPFAEFFLVRIRNDGI